MATLTDTSPTFARLTEGRATNSWRSAIPLVVVVVAVIALLAYLASRVSSYSQALAATQRDAADTHAQMGALQKQAIALQKELEVAKSAGRTTVILRSDAKDSKAWAAATWGEAADGKSWMRLSAYGLAPAPSGKQYDVWFEPKTGDPVAVGSLQVDDEGSAFVLGENLPAVDQGKVAVISLDAEGAKAPDQVVVQAPLPELKPAAEPAASPQ